MSAAAAEAQQDAARLNEIVEVGSETKLLHFLTDQVDEAEGNDWLYRVISRMVGVHNEFSDSFRSAAAAPNPVAQIPPRSRASNLPRSVRGLPIIRGSQSVSRIGLTQQRQIAERSAALTVLENRLTLLCPGLARGKSVRAGIPVARAASA